MKIDKNNDNVSRMTAKFIPEINEEIVNTEPVKAENEEKVSFS